MIVFDQKEKIGDWVGEKIGNELPWHDYEAIGIIQDGEIIGGAVINGYTQGMCSIHCAGVGHWLSFDFLTSIFNYAFNQLGCNAVVNIVDAMNTKSVRFTKHLGFTEVHRIRGGCGESDGIILELLKKDCRYI